MKKGPEDNRPRPLEESDFSVPSYPEASFVERIIGWCANNQFLVLVATVFLIVAGVIAVKRINLDAIPDLSDVQVIVFTEWMGRDPQLVEDQITYPIVSVLAAAPNVKYVRGQTFFGLSFVNVVFEDGTDMYWARSRVLEYLNQVMGDLPPGIRPTLGPDATGVGWVYEYALVDRTGQNSLADLRSLQDWTLRYYLQNTPGVAEVASIGGYVREYQVDVDPNKLVAYNIPLSKVVAAIRDSNNDVGGRVIEFGETEYMVKGVGYIKEITDIEKISLGVDADGTPITVKQVANVHFGPDLRRGVLELDGEGEAVGGIVIMRYGENALTTIEAIKAKLEAIKPSLPPGVEIVTGYDRSDLIIRAIDNLKWKLIEESIVVSLVCIIFLFHLRSALVAILVLPIAILLSFILMAAMGVSSNIMSLGGIAIAIGAMVDAAVVMIENAHKWLERWNHARAKRNKEGDDALTPGERSVANLTRLELMVMAARQVGKPLFFSLLIITVSFLPVFALEGQSGRLFKPLAYTKTFSMFFAALLSVSIVPILMVWFIRGKIFPENKHPISRFFTWAYRPFLAFVLRFRWITLLAAAVVLGVTWIPFSRIGSEFMPPLREGTLLFMPTSVPGISITEAKALLQRQDAIIASHPEVERVYGKAGRARTATDPAPLSMTETVITLKPEDEWREGMTFEKIKEELDEMVRTPGAPAIWWMPIQTRIEMLATGIRSQIGIKVLGPDLAVIQEVAVKIESVLKGDPNTATVFAERVTGGYYVDFEIKRDEIARYGLTVGDVEMVIETAIGGKTISTTVEGRERYPINVRYAQEFREDLPALRRVLVPTPTGAQIPLEQLADIRKRTGPPAIRDENGMLAGFVFVDTKDIDLGSYVVRAKELIADNVEMPAGYFLQWGGQYQYMQKARETLQLVVPATLLIIFVLLYLNFRNPVEVFIVLLTLPFAAVGSIWLMWGLGYNFSVAVAVGFIALAGVATEIGVIMIVYLDEAWQNLLKGNRRPSYHDLSMAIRDGAAQRVRPVMMTFFAIVAGLLPIMWSHGTGSLAMKRIAAPMVGGMVSTTILTLLIVPLVYFLWRSRAVEAPTIRERSGHIVRNTAITLGIVLLGVGGWWGWNSIAGTSGPSHLILTEEIGPYRLNLFGDKAKLSVGDNKLRVEVVNAASDDPVENGAVWLELRMDMPGMPMQATAQLELTDDPGVFSGFIRPSGSGEWHGTVGVRVGQVQNETGFTINVAQ
ncbi:MAG: CusA/CzcA family heavy metal efflux RND transporter [Opitutaceae bacterium]